MSSMLALFLAITMNTSSGAIATTHTSTTNTFGVYITEISKSSNNSPDSTVCKVEIAKIENGKEKIIYSDVCNGVPSSICNDPNFKNTLKNLFVPKVVRNGLSFMILQVKHPLAESVCQNQ